MSSIISLKKIKSGHSLVDQGLLKSASFKKLPEMMKSNRLQKVTSQENLTPMPKQIVQSDRSRLQKKLLKCQILSSKLPLPSAIASELLESHFSELEKEEVMDYSIVYYKGNKSWLYRRREGPNKGYDDERGMLLFYRGDHIAYRYSIIQIIGRGTFGVVCKAYDHKNKEEVAIKVVCNQKLFSEQAKKEIRILRALKSWDVNQSYNVIAMKNHFRFRKHQCIVFELLDRSLYDTLKMRNFNGFSLETIKIISKQVLELLVYIKTLGIIHCDLKPENIVFCNRKGSAVKVIDFGSACYMKKKQHSYVQSRFYRAPEIMLRLKYTTAVDIWSFGCIIHELYTGMPLFAGKNEKEQMSLIADRIGPPPEELLSVSRKKYNFNFSSQYKLSEEDSEISDLIYKCLRWVPSQRITPEKALEHPFISKIEEY